MKHRGNNEGSTRPIRPKRDDDQERWAQTEYDLIHRLNEYKARIRRESGLELDEKINWSEVEPEVVLNVQADAREDEIIYAHRQLAKIFNFDQNRKVSIELLNEVGEIQKNLNIARVKLISRLNKDKVKKTLTENEISSLLDIMEEELEVWRVYRLGNNQPSKVTPYRILGIKPGADESEVQKAFKESAFRFYIQFKPLFSESNKLIRSELKEKIHSELQEILGNLQKARKHLLILLESQKNVRDKLARFRQPDYQPTIEELISDLRNLGHARVSAAKKEMTGIEQAEIITELYEELKQNRLTAEQVDNLKVYLTTGQDLGFQLRQYVVNFLKRHLG